MVEAGEALGTNGEARGGRNRGLGLATAAVALAPIPAMGGEWGVGLVLERLEGVGESGGVLHLPWGALLLWGHRRAARHG